MRIRDWNVIRLVERAEKLPTGGSFSRSQSGLERDGMRSIYTEVSWGGTGASFLRGMEAFDAKTSPFVMFSPFFWRPTPIGPMVRI